MLSCFCDPQIENTSGVTLYRGQRGSQAFLIDILTDVSTSIGGGLGLKPMTACTASTALFTIRPLRLGLISKVTFQHQAISKECHSMNDISHFQSETN